jgi:hypothetical protein
VQFKHLNSFCQEKVAQSTQLAAGTAVRPNGYANPLWRKALIANKLTDWEGNNEVEEEEEE